MDIKGISGPTPDNPPSIGRVDTSTVHPTLAVAATKPIGEQAISRIWQVGALLQLMVTQVQGKTVSLSLPQAGADVPLLQTRTDLPLVPGQAVTVKVTGDLKNPSLQLIQLSQSPQDILSSTLRQQLPQQQPLSPILANLNWAAKQVATPAPVASTPLPPQVVELARGFIESLPTSQQLRDPNQLFKAMHLSGQYLEHTLMNRAMAQPHFNPEQDVRSQLLRLAQVLRQLVNLPTPGERPAPTAGTPPPAAATAAAQLAGQAAHAEAKETIATPSPAPASRTQTAEPQAASNASLAALTDPKRMAEELLQQVDGALSRMQSQQLQSLQTEQQGRHVWLMELPVRHEDGVDLFDLRIQRDGQNKEGREQSESWSMTLAFDLEGLGAIRVKVSLHNEAITANFWAEQPETRRLFHEHIEYLRSRLNQSGLEVEELSCKCGIPPEPPVYRESHLLDERA